MKMGKHTSAVSAGCLFQDVINCPLKTKKQCKQEIYTNASI